MPEQRKSWRDVIKVHPAAELFPLMTADELKALGEDIRKDGMHVPVILWDEKNKPMLLLDGRNRLDAIEAAGIIIGVENVGTESDPEIALWKRAPPEHSMPWAIGITILRGDQGRDPYEYVISANIHRRHLTAEQKRDIIAAVLKAQPEKSNRTIARQTKADHKTVGAVRERLEAGGEIPHHDVHEDARGTRQPAQKPAARKKQHALTLQAA